MHRWVIGGGPDPRSDTGVILLDGNWFSNRKPHGLAQLLLHRALNQPLPTASEVLVELPPFRPPSLVQLLALLAGRLATSGHVTWSVEPRHRKLLIKVLIGDGWEIADIGKSAIRAVSPRIPRALQTARIRANLGRCDVDLLADYGVFAAKGLDAGTTLLLDAALQRDPVETVADVGTGYGPLALGLLLNGQARTAVASDTDCVALLLAQLNAERLGHQLQVSANPDPRSLPATSLTLCNIPTHIDRPASERLLDGLAARALSGSLMVVVHAALESRYAAGFAGRGLAVDHLSGDDHVVLTCER